MGCVPTDCVGTLGSVVLDDPVQELVQHLGHEGGDPLDLVDEPPEELGLPLAHLSPVDANPAELLEDAAGKLHQRWFDTFLGGDTSYVYC